MAGRATFTPSSETYRTNGGVTVRRIIESIPIDNAIEPVIDALDSQRGVLLASSYEYPGRYTRWDMGFYNPPLALVSRGRRFSFSALNGRGHVLLPAIANVVSNLPAVVESETKENECSGLIATPEGRFPEEHLLRVAHGH